MYKEYYGFNADPFRLTADNRNWYSNSSLSKARSYLHYGLQMDDGIVLVTGPSGSGKSTLVSRSLAETPGMSLDTVVVECTDYSGMELLRHYGRVLVDSEIKPEISEALNAITYGLIQAVSEGKKCLLVLDQAHELSEDALRKLVLLANLKVDGSPLLQIFMVGQPALRQTLLQPEYEALHQRLVATCNLDRFTAEETREYIIHNLTACGWQGTPEICPNVFSIIHQTSMGMPRWINLIGSRLLLQGMINEKEKIGLPDTCEVLRELLNEDLLPETVRRANLKDAKLKVA